MNLNHLKTNSNPTNQVTLGKDRFRKSLVHFESLGTNTLVLLFNSILSSSPNSSIGLLNHYDLKTTKDFNFINTNPRLNKRYTKYIIDFADHVTLTTPFTIRFASHFSNTIVLNNNSLILFSNLNSY